MSKIKLSRRDFLKLTGAAATSLALSACGMKATELSTPALAPVATLTPESTATETETLTPTLTSTPTLTPTPKPPTVGDLGRKIGLDIGICTRIKQWDKFRDPKYVNALLNFSMLEDGMASNPFFTDSNWSTGQGNAFDYMDYLSDFTLKNNMGYSPNHLFWEGYFVNKNSPVYHLLNASNDEIEKWMNDRVKKFFEIPYFSYVNFANEAINSNWNTKQPVWNSRPSPMYKVFGQDWVEKAYRLTWNEAKNTGKTIGEHLHLVYNTAGLETESPRADYEFKFLSELKSRLSQDFGIARPFDIGMQFHVRCSGGLLASQLDKKKIIKQIQRFGEIGDIRITEFSICDPTDIEKEKAILNTVIESAIESGVCRSFLMWDAFAPLESNTTQKDLEFSMLHLFDKDYQPLYMFNELYNTLQSYS
jgi:hypothetical protein